MRRIPAAAIVILNCQRRVRVPRTRIVAAVRAAFRERGRKLLPLSIVVVSDPAIRRLHRRFLGLDCATDVLSFPLEAGREGWLGEVVISADTARRVAPRVGVPVSQELTLYAVHGVLHLLGRDDHHPRDRRRMRQAERHCLRAAGFSREPRVDG